MAEEPPSAEVNSAVGVIVTKEKNLSGGLLVHERRHTMEIHPREHGQGIVALNTITAPVYGAQKKQPLLPQVITCPLAIKRGGRAHHLQGAPFEVGTYPEIGEEKTAERGIRAEG